MSGNHILYDYAQKRIKEKEFYMNVVFLKAINEAPLINIQDITIDRVGLNVDLSSLTRDSLRGLVQEFEERRLYVDDILALFYASGELLNEDGTGSAGDIPNSSGGGTGGDGTDTVVRVEIGNRYTNYVNVFNTALIT